MPTLKTYPKNNSAILRINSERSIIDVSPEYQRQGEIWNLEKRQLLIDSILNDYDIPKLYFHALPRSRTSKSSNPFEYAIIDGKQRIETIWSFIDGKFSLARDFKFYKDPSVQAGNLTYSDLAKKYPNLKIIFDSFVLPIVLVDTDDIELIEDMFSRLNEAVPLNAAEKRTAIGGPMARTINHVSQHDFFKQKAYFTNRRFQYREVAAKLLYLEHLVVYSEGKMSDTKKPYLDAFVREYKKNKKYDAGLIESRVTGVLDKMYSIFEPKDKLLKSTIIPIYYLLVRDAVEKEKLKAVKRTELERFDENVRENRKIAEEDITKANFDLLEFDRMSQQGTNDSASIRERLRILSDYLGI